MQKIHSARMKNLGIQLGTDMQLPSIKSMRRITNFVNTAVPQRLAWLSAAAADVDMSLNKRNKHVHQMTSRIASAETEFKGGLVMLQEDNDWWYQTVEFIKHNMKLFLCLVNEGAKSPLLKTVMEMDGKDLSQVWEIGEKAVWKFIETMFDATKNVIMKALADIDKTMAEKNMFLSMNFFGKRIFDVMNEFSRVEPTLKCFVPMVEGFMNRRDVKQWQNDAISDTNELFQKVVFDEGNEIWTQLFDDAINEVGKIVPVGPRWSDHKKFKQLRVTATATILHMENEVNRIVISGLKKLDDMTPGDARAEALNGINNLLKGDFSSTVLLKAGFGVTQQLVTEWVNEQVAFYLPALWDTTLNWVGVVIIPAVTFGLNELASSGMWATEWISTVPMNIIQGAWEFFQAKAAHFFTVTAPAIISMLVNYIFDWIFEMIIEPVRTNILEPIDNFVKGVQTTIEEAVEKVSQSIPPGVMNIFKNIAQTMFRSFMRAIHPELGKQTRLSIQFARALVLREKQTIAQWEKRHRGPTPPPTPAKLGWEPLKPNGPTSQPTPHPPIYNPTPRPTPSPAVGFNWARYARDAKYKAIVAAQGKAKVYPDHHEAGDVDINPEEEVPSRQTAHLRKEALAKDPVFRHVSEWLKRRQAGRL
jgi:hypothetical protein